MKMYALRRGKTYKFVVYRRPNGKQIFVKKKIELIVL
jgi:hypothetical protein